MTYNYLNALAKGMRPAISIKPSYEYAYVLVGILGLPIKSLMCANMSIVASEFPELLDDIRFKDSLYCVNNLFAKNFAEKVHIVTAPNRSTMIHAHEEIIKRVIYDGNRIYMEHEMGFEVNTLLDWITDCPRSESVIEIRGARK